MRSFRSAPQPPSDAAPDKIVRLFQSETGEILEAPEPAGTRATTYMSAALIVVLVILAAITRLDRVIQSVGGEIVSTTPTEVLQSLDPALIKTINVRVGDRVKAGDVLATLDPTFVAADADALRLQVANYDAQIARAEAELAGRAYTPPPVSDATAARYGEIQ
jgi:HlyD family secretion protein